ncbi:MAG TPA: UPF0223 family protein [Lactobacillaceae bacterium]|jgi:uncharacterized protein YktA (UPF0223 family)
MKNLDDYQLPIDLDWTTAEIIAVSEFVDAVFAAHEQGVDRERLLALYNAYRQVLPAKSEQKTFERQIEQDTNISIFQTIKTAQATSTKQVKLT